MRVNAQLGALTMALLVDAPASPGFDRDAKVRGTRQIGRRPDYTHNAEQRLAKASAKRARKAAKRLAERAR